MSAAVELSSPLPREIVPGIFWLGECIHLIRDDGPTLHSYNSVYLVTGDRHSVLVEAGFPPQLPTIECQLARLLEDAPPLRYVFMTHMETPHAGGVGRLLERYPNVEACGDVTDLHLVFPEFADRLRAVSVGDELDLGGTVLRIEPALFLDFPSTCWAFDTARRVLFTGDGFAYAHYHQAGQCGRLAEEVPELDLPDMSNLFAEFAFYWTGFVDLDRFIDPLSEMVLGDRDIRLLAPTHGLPIADPAATFPRVAEGLRRGGRQPHG